MRSYRIAVLAGDGIGKEDVMSKFLAMRAQQDRHWKQKKKMHTSSGESVQRRLIISDPLDGNSGQNGDVLVCSSHVGSASSRARLIRALRADSCGLQIVLAEHSKVNSDSELRGLLLERANALFVVPVWIVQ